MESITTNPYWVNRTSPLFVVAHKLTSGNTKNTAVIVLNSGFLHNIGPYRLYVDMANVLSLGGHTVIRLDQSGKGESPVRHDISGMEAKLLDYDEIFEHLKIDHGVSNCILVGLCSGADDALEIADARDTVSGLVLLDGFSPVTKWYYASHYFTRLRYLRSWLLWKKRQRDKRSNNAAGSVSSVAMSLRRWESEKDVKSMYESVLKRGVKTLAVFTGSVGDYYNHRGQLSRGLNAPTDNLAETYFRDAAHIYSLPEHRRLLVEEVDSWMQRQYFG